MATVEAPMKYTVIVRDEVFTLRRTQLEFDAPNYFTSYFFGDFAEAGAGVTSLTLDRSPELFALIVEYMSGYHILPLTPKALPRTMDVRTALRNLIEDAAFYGLSRLHTLLSSPIQPTIDFSWTGFSGKVVSFGDVLRGNLPPTVSYTTSGLCSFDSGSVKPVIIFAQNIALKLCGNPDLDKAGRPEPGTSTASYMLVLNREMKAQLERQPYSAFEFNEDDSLALVVSVYPESRLRIDSESAVRFEHFPAWWRTRRVRYTSAPPPSRDELSEHAERVFSEAFPQPFEDEDYRRQLDTTEFRLWADELLFVITARGFIAGTLQLHVKLLDVKARTRLAVLDSLRPPYLQEKNTDELC